MSIRASRGQSELRLFDSIGTVYVWKESRKCETLSLYLFLRL